MNQDEELWEREDCYPPLCPPTRLKKEILENEDFRDLDSRARIVPESSKESFKELIEYPIKDLNSDLRKLRAIFTWMGAQKVGTEDLNENCEDFDSPRCYLKHAVSNRSFIDKLFAKLCRGAEIPCILTDGKTKGASYETGDDNVGVNTWAVVYVDGSWRFVFPDWAFVATSGHQNGNWMVVEDSGQPSRQRLTDSDPFTIFDVNEFWFLTDPDEMNCFCHPRDDDKQLLTHTWTEQQFYSMPRYLQSYFTSGWNLLSPTECVIKANRGSCEIEFQPPTPDVKLNPNLIFNEKPPGSRLPENIQMKLYVSSHQKDGGQRLSLVIRLPVEGRYKIEVTGVHGSKTCSLVEFRIDCDSVPPHTPPPFPSQPEIGFGYGDTAVRAGLSEPSHTEGLVPERPGQEIHFSFKVEENVDFSARLVHATRPPEELRDNVSVQQEMTNATVTVRLPEDDHMPEYSLEIDITKIEEGDWRNALNYLLTSDEVLTEISMDKTKELKAQHSKNVYDALAEDDVRFFEEAVFDFETDEHEDPILFEKIEIRKARYKQMLMDLRAFTKERQLGRLDNAIRECVHVKLQRGDIEAAKRKLVLLYKDEIQKFLEEESLNNLRECLEEVTNTCVGESVEKEAWFQDARDRYEELDILENNKANLQSMAEEDIADLCRPPDIAIDVIYAALILLGESQEELTTWKHILTEVTQLLARMCSSEESSLTPEQVEVAKKRLRRHDWTSHDDTTAKKLYTWCMDRINLHELRKNRNQRR